MFLCLDRAAIALYRYDDPILGPTIKPTSEDIVKGKTEIPYDSTFIVNADKGTVEISVMDQTYPLGHEIIYIDKSQM